MECFSMVQTQYKSLLLKNWTGDGGSRIVSHRSNISSPQDMIPMRYMRTSPVYQGQSYWTDGEMSMRNAPQIRDMEIQTSLSMLNTPLTSSYSMQTPLGFSRNTTTLPQEGNQDGGSAGSSTNHLDNFEPGEKEDTPEWNKMFPTSGVTSTITTSQSDYHPSPKRDEAQSLEIQEECGEKLMNEEPPKLSQDEPRKESFYLQEVPDDKTMEQEMDGRKMVECHTPEHREAEEEVPEKTIDSGQSEITEQLGNLSTTETRRKPHTSSLRHALLKNTNLTGSRSGGGDKGGQKVVKKVEFCLDQNESHEDTKSHWNVEEIGETASHYAPAEIEVSPQEPIMEERTLMSTYKPEHAKTYEIEDDTEQYDEEYDQDEANSETQEYQTQNQDESAEEGDDYEQGQGDYAAEEPTAESELMTQNSGYNQYPDAVQEPEAYYAGVEENIQPTVEENAYIQGKS